MTNNAYPRDVTSPGPYQQRGVAGTQKSSTPQTPRLGGPPMPDTINHCPICEERERVIKELLDACKEAVADAEQAVNPSARLPNYESMKAAIAKAEEMK